MDVFQPDYVATPDANQNTSSKFEREKSADAALGSALFLGGSVEAYHTRRLRFVPIRQCIPNFSPPDFLT